MKPTEHLRLQHKEMVILVMQMGQLLDPKELGKDARPIRELLSELSGKLRVHLAMEDQSLYPRLLTHRDEPIRNRAQAFLTEMGGLKARFAAYVRDWPSATSIERDPERFIEVTQEIFLLLYKRMEKENKELHPMADQAGLI